MGQAFGLKNRARVFLQCIRLTLKHLWLCQIIPVVMFGMMCIEPHTCGQSSHARLAGVGHELCARSNYEHARPTGEERSREELEKRRTFGRLGLD